MLRWMTEILGFVEAVDLFFSGAFVWAALVALLPASLTYIALVAFFGSASAFPVSFLINVVAAVGLESFF